MRKRGQVEGQIVVYVLAGVVVILVLLYGYKAIQDFKDKADTVSYIQFKKDFDRTVQSVASDFGSELIEEFRLPATDDEVCIAPSKGGFSGNVQHPNPSNVVIVGDTGRPIVVDGIDADSNIFLLKKGELVDSPFFVDNIKTPSNDIYCFHASEYRVKIRFVGEGDGTSVQPI